MPEAAGSASAAGGAQSDEDARKEQLRKAGQEYFEKVLAQVMHTPTALQSSALTSTQALAALVLTLGAQTGTNAEMH